MYLVRTLHCNPLPLVNATKKKKCWPWETQRLDFEGVFLEAWVCNWVERQGGWLWWCSRKHKGECVCVREHTDKKRKKHRHTQTKRHTHTCKRNPRHRLTSMHSAKHIHDRQAGPVEATARRFGTLWGFRAAAGSSSPGRIRMSPCFLQEALQYSSAARSKTPALMGVQLDQRTSNPRTSLVQCWHWS